MDERKSNVCPTEKNKQNKEDKIFKEKMARISPN